MIIYNEIKPKLLSKKKRKGKLFWVAKISILAFSLSLFLSFFSQIVLKQSNIILALILLCIFMVVNVVSDMIGLAITSCQIDELNKKFENGKMRENIYKRSLRLIINSDKVSSILCDVIGDICGILCGVSGTILTNIIISNNTTLSLYLFVAAIVSSIIAGFTVLFKAIAKNFAVKNSLKIVRKISEILLIFTNFK